MSTTRIWFISWSRVISICHHKTVTAAAAATEFNSLFISFKYFTFIIKSLWEQDSNEHRLGLRCTRNYVSSAFSMHVSQAATGQWWVGRSRSTQEHVGSLGANGSRNTSSKCRTWRDNAHSTSRCRDSVAVKYTACWRVPSSNRSRSKQVVDSGQQALQ